MSAIHTSRGSVQHRRGTDEPLKSEGAIMSSLTLLKRALILGAVGIVLGFSSAPGVVSEARAQSTRSYDEEEQVAVQEGAQLYGNRRWAEAIEFYEKSLKTWPKNEQLKLGLRHSKVHYSIERRYADKSFVTTMLPLSRREALVYLDDVLEKVRHYYVDSDSVDAKYFVAHGTESLYFALKNEKFIERNIPYADSARIVQVTKRLKSEYWNRPLVGTDGARRVVLEIADMAQRELNLAPSAVIMEYVFGGCNSLDEYSSYLTPGKLGDLYNNIDGEFVGIGIEMKAESGKGMMLVNVLPESPADEGGAKSGDWIVAIDGRDCRKMSTEEAAALLQGQPNSRVRITLSDPDSGDERVAQLTRRAVKVKSIPVVEMVDPANHIGYIRMTGFQKNTPEELDQALTKLRRQGMQALIWDLRGNPGGLLPAAVEVLDRFLGNGVIVSTRGNGHVADQNTIYSAHEDSTDWNGPLVLLVDGDSASASEIVAGAVHDHHRGTIVGRKTYGKWSVQSILPGHSESGFRLTTAKFYSPNGDNYSKKGIEPDIKVTDDSERKLSTRNRPRNQFRDDRDVETGLDTLRKQLAKR